MGIFGGLFGQNRRKALGEAIDIGGLEDQARAEGDGSLPTMPKRPGLFGTGGKGWDVVGNTADALLQMRGGPAVYDDGSKKRLQQMILAAQIAQQQHIANRQYDAQNPLPDQFERTLEMAGIPRGSPQWVAMMKKRALNQSDPPHMVTGPDGGAMLVGGGYGYPGQPPAQDDGYDELPPGYQVGGGEGGPYQPVPAQPTYSNVVDPAGEAAMIKALGPAGYQQWKRKYGLQVMGNR